MITFPWKSKAVCLSAPKPEDVDRFCGFIRRVFAADGIDTLVLLTRYSYAFESHPECRGENPITRADVKKILAACRESGIELVPKMNVLGHQSDADGITPDGLLKGHPEFDETPGIEKTEYCRSLCPNHPGVLPIMLDLIDEMAEAFEAKTFHIGCDEVFRIGECPRCKGTPTGEIFAGWVNTIAAHLKEKGIRPMMWGDRLLNGEETGYGHWEASANGTWTSLGKVDKDIILCDWHYEDWKGFPSPRLFAENGYKIYLATSYHVPANISKFVDAVKADDPGNVLGVMCTTWLYTDLFMDACENSFREDVDPDLKKYALEVWSCYKYQFED